jgi:hypothetical protein
MSIFNVNKKKELKAKLGICLEIYKKSSEKDIITFKTSNFHRISMQNPPK